MASFIHNFVNKVLPISTNFLVKSKDENLIKKIRSCDMSEETTIERVEHKIDTHIEKHNEDYKRLLWWIIGSLIGVMGSTAAWFISMGTMQEKVAQIERNEQTYVTRVEFDGLENLLTEKFTNINNKLDEIKNALHVR